MSYLVFKILHILFAVLFLGNIIVSVFWKLHSDKTGDPKIIAHTLRGIIKAGKMFTMPGVIGLLVFGFAGQGIGKIPISAPWILWSLVLYVISGAAFMIKVSPLQKKMAAVAEEGINGSFDSAKYRDYSLDWNVWGLAAIIAPLIALVLMVFKPM